MLMISNNNAPPPLRTTTTTHHHHHHHHRRQTTPRLSSTARTARSAGSSAAGRAPFRDAAPRRTGTARSAAPARCATRRGGRGTPRRARRTTVSAGAAMGRAGRQWRPGGRASGNKWAGKRGQNRETDATAQLPAVCHQPIPLIALWFARRHRRVARPELGAAGVRRVPRPPQPRGRLWRRARGRDERPRDRGALRRWRCAELC